MKKTCVTLQLKSIKSFNSFGFQITGGVGNGSVIKVLEIEPKSPAQLAGMLKDDTILSVNTIDLSEMMKHEVEEMFKSLWQRENSVKLKISRIALVPMKTTSFKLLQKRF